MKRLLSAIFSLLYLMLALCSCGNAQLPDSDEQNTNDLLVGTEEDVLVDGALTILLCGTATHDVEVAVSEFETAKGIKVNVIKYEKDDDWAKFATKVMSQITDFDLFMPVPYHIPEIILNEAYLELSEFDEIKSRIESNSITDAVANMDGKLFGMPCNIQLSYSGDYKYAATNMKYCYKNLNLFTKSYLDPDGEELFEVLKFAYQNPGDDKQNPYYDFEFYDAYTQYVFMNRYTEKKELASEFLCLLFDILNKNIESAAILPYPTPENGEEYMPSWIYYGYEFVEPIGNAVSSVADTDGSDEALRKLAREAARQVKMRLEG